MTLEEFIAKPLSVQASIALQLAIETMNELDVTQLSFKIRLHTGTQQIDLVAKEIIKQRQFVKFPMPDSMIKNLERWGK